MKALSTILIGMALALAITITSASSETLRRGAATAPQHAAQNHDGIWNGHFDINGRGNFKFNALYVGGELIALSRDARVSYRGTFSIDDGRYHSAMEMFVLSNGVYFDSVTLQGELTAAGQIEAHFTTAGAKDQGTLKLVQDSASYHSGAHLAKVNDQWIYYHGFTITKFAISEDGRMDGADTNGCGYEGEIEVIAADYNAYRVKLLVNSCYDLDGVYEGMAYLLSSIDEDDTLNIQVYKDGQALYLPIVRDAPPQSPSQQPS